MQLNFDNYLDKMRGCWNGKNIGGTLGAPFEGMRGVFDVRIIPCSRIPSFARM